MRVHPVIAIILGFIVAFIINVFIYNLTILGVSNSVLEQMMIVIDVGSLVIGGFIATYFAKEKKIQYGIYVGIIWVVLMGLLPSLILGVSTSILDFIIVTYIVYIVASITGSYLAILVIKHRKLNI